MTFEAVTVDREEGQQVAALCWRRAPMLEILVITSLRRHRWILPKGWPEPGLTPAQSAAKEALEEAGVTGEVTVAAIGRYRYLKERKDGGTPCSVDIFALQVTHQRRTWPEKGVRDLAWLPVKQAATRVAEPELRRILLDFGKSNIMPVRTPGHRAVECVRAKKLRPGPARPFHEARKSR